MGEKKSHKLLVGMQTTAASIEINMEVQQKHKNRPAFMTLPYHC
jgi:hypothetical protein